MDLIFKPEGERKLERTRDPEEEKSYPNLPLPEPVPIEAPKRFERFRRSLQSETDRKLMKGIGWGYSVIVPLLLTSLAWIFNFSMGGVVIGYTLIGIFLLTVWEVDAIGMPWESRKDWKGFGIATLISWGVMGIASLIFWPISLLF